MSQENVEAFKRAVEALERRDVEAALEELDSEVEWYSAILVSLGGDTTVYRRHEGVRELLRYTWGVFAEFHYEFLEIRDLGDRIVAIGRLRARGKESGAETESPLGSVVDFENGKAIRFRTYLDQKEALEAAGGLRLRYQRDGRGCGPSSYKGRTLTDSVPAEARGQVTLREAEPGDTEACAQILFDAFGGLHDHHRFARDFPELEAATGFMGMWIPHPSVWGVVAEVDGRIVGSNFLDERGPIRGVGPITVDPQGQNAGVGRKLMGAVMERGEGAPGIRLLQDAFHMRSLSLYESLGFDVKEPVAVMTGKPRSDPVQGVEVRPLAEDDLEHCAALGENVHGFERTNELRDAIQAFAPFVAVLDGRLVAYASSVTFWPMNHGVAESEDDMKALLKGAASVVEEPLAFLVPLRTGLFRWGLEEGLRLMKPMNLMALGEYQEPRGSWFPSVLY